jgi:hypothetical protein
VVHRRRSTLLGGLFWVPLNHGKVELAQM